MLEFEKYMEYLIFRKSMWQASKNLDFDRRISKKVVLAGFIVDYKKELDRRGKVLSKTIKSENMCRDKISNISKKYNST